MAMAIVPARGGSKGIYQKNIAPCAGKPLIVWTIEAALQAETLSLIVVSSDDPAIMGHVEEDEGNRIRKVYRPIQLARDDTPTEAVIAHVLEQYEAMTIVLLQPTSPIRTGKQIDEAVRLLEREQADAVVSVHRSHHLLWKLMEGCPIPLYNIDRRPRRQELEQYEENGNIYVFSLAHWKEKKNRLGGSILLYEMPEECGYQVDSPLDMEVVAGILARRQKAAGMP